MQRNTTVRAALAGIVLMAIAPHHALARQPAPATEPATEGPVQGDEKVNQLIVFGNDPCPASSGNEITVCARKEEGERYRIPAPLRDNPNSPKNEAWSEKVRAYETVGASGTNSCSPIGGGGATGCMAQLIHQAYAERKSSSDVQFSKLIEAERQRRLQSIDKDAAAEQARVEELEKDYEARLAKERDGPEEHPTASPSPASPSPASPSPASSAPAAPALATPPADTAHN